MSRNRCQKCRYEKCITVGMDKSAVRENRGRRRKKDADKEQELNDTRELMMLKSTVVTAYRAAFPKDTATRNKEDAKKKIHIFWDKITQLESIAEDDAMKQVTRRFILVMLLRAIFTEDKCEEIVGDHKQLFADFLFGLNDEVQEEELALLTALCLTMPCGGLQETEQIQKINCDLHRCFEAHLAVRSKGNASQLHMILWNKIMTMHSEYLQRSE